MDNYFKKENQEDLESNSKTKEICLILEKKLEKEIEENLKILKENLDLKTQLELIKLNSQDKKDLYNQNNLSLQEFFDNVPLLVWFAEPNGYVNYFNKTFVEYVGLPSGDINGWKWHSVLHSDDLAQVIEKWTHSIQTGTEFEVICRLKRSDNQYRWNLIKTNPLKNSAKEITKWLGISIDIHEQKEIQEKTEISENDYRSLIDNNTPALLWVTDIDGYCTYINQQWCDYTGTTLKENLGMGWLNSVHPNDLEESG